MSVKEGDVCRRSSQTLGLIIFRMKRELQLSVLIRLIKLLNRRSERWRKLWLSSPANSFGAYIDFPDFVLSREYPSNRTCREISGMFVVGTTSLKPPVSGYFTLVLLACDSHPNEYYPRRIKWNHYGFKLPEAETVPSPFRGGVNTGTKYAERMEFVYLQIEFKSPKVCWLWS